MAIEGTFVLGVLGYESVGNEKRSYLRERGVDGSFGESLLLVCSSSLREVLGDVEGWIS
jgi:hypothetical protein